MGGPGSGRKAISLPEEEIKERYLHGQRSLRDLARTYGVSADTIRARLLKLGVPRRRPGGAESAYRRWQKV